MTDTPLVLRQAARQDIDGAVDFYVDQAGEAVALRFVASLERTFRVIARHPAAGSLRYGHELDLPGLRSRALRGFPYLVIYVERPDHVDFWRVLHAHRDIPAHLQEPP